MREKLAQFEEEEALDIKYKLRHFTKFKVLLVVTSILAVLSITFIVLYAVEKSIDYDSANEQGKTPRVQTYCGTKVCFDAALGKPNCSLEERFI